VSWVENPRGREIVESGEERRGKTGRGEKGNGNFTQRTQSVQSTQRREEYEGARDYRRRLRARNVNGTTS
jgi:hypothetical protein